MRLKESYDNIPWYNLRKWDGVSEEERFENLDGIIEDDYRIEFIQDHLAELHWAIEARVPCFGYHLWTLRIAGAGSMLIRIAMVTTEWISKTGLCARTPKQSSFWMADVIAKNGFSGNKFAYLAEMVYKKWRVVDWILRRGYQSGGCFMESVEK